MALEHDMPNRVILLLSGGTVSIFALLLAFEFLLYLFFASLRMCCYVLSPNHFVFTATGDGDGTVMTLRGSGWFINLCFAFGNLVYCLCLEI